MKEELIAFAWQYRLYKKPLQLEDGTHVEVIDVGSVNTDSGPDFFNAKLKMGGTLWVGNVEIHAKASDWNLHGHQTDKAYNNVILHVVVNNDMLVRMQSGAEMATAILSINQRVIEQYFVMQNKSSWLRCEDQLVVPDFLTWISIADRLLIERLEYRTLQFTDILEQTQNNWELAFYRLLARAYGFGLNADAMQMLASKIPDKLFKLSNSLFEVEALCFGVAGLINKDCKDDYALRLKEHYFFLKQKYNLVELDSQIWKFSKTRPGNFPTLRIAQFASLLFHSKFLFSHVQQATSISNLEGLFKVQPSIYWKEHYQFGKKVLRKNNYPGKTALNGIIINMISPFLFLYGKVIGKNEVSEKAFVFLRTLKAEDNTVIRKWKEMGLGIHTASDSQAVIHLKKHYCDKRECLKCKLGQKILCNY